MQKLQKHILLIKRQIGQNNNISKIFGYNNEMLNKVANAFLKAKKNEHDQKALQAFGNCEQYRQRLLTDDSEITYEVFSSDKKSTVKEICQIAASDQKRCQFLYHLANEMENPTVLEIGTNTGVSGSYILEALKPGDGKLITMEGLPQLCDLSQKQFETIVPSNQFEIVQGLYDDTFPMVISKNETFDLLFIDGNHQKEPTLAYFNALKSQIGQRAIFLFDDIYWSQGMEEAWEIIKADKDVSFAIDLYKQGVVVVDTQEKQRDVSLGLHLSY